MRIQWLNGFLLAIVGIYPAFGQSADFILKNQDILFSISIHQNTDSTLNYQVKIQNIGKRDIFIVDTNEYNHSTINGRKLCAETNPQRKRTGNRTLHICLADYDAPYPQGLWFVWRYKLIRLRPQDSLTYHRELQQVLGFYSIRQIEQTTVHFAYGKAKRFHFISYRLLVRKAWLKGVIGRKLKGRYYEITLFNKDCVGLVKVDKH
jgi:hypothetical protein